MIYMPYIYAQHTCVCYIRLCLQSIPAYAIYVRAYMAYVRYISRGLQSIHMLYTRSPSIISNDHRPTVFSLGILPVDSKSQFLIIFYSCAYIDQRSVSPTKKLMDAIIIIYFLGKVAVDSFNNCSTKQITTQAISLAG